MKAIMGGKINMKLMLFLGFGGRVSGEFGGKGHRKALKNIDFDSFWIGKR